MDSLITAASRALAAGDPLGALKHVALRSDPPALALRGISMAQLGELDRARELLRKAAQAFGAGEPMARARCVVAEAEVALAARRLSSSSRALETACETLEAHGDARNAAHGRLVRVRALLLMGRIDAAEEKLRQIDPSFPMLVAIAELVRAEVALRRLQPEQAGAALKRAALAAEQARIPALSTEIERALSSLEMPAARLRERERERAILLAEVAGLRSSDAIVVDACRRSVHHRGNEVKLARRPVLFRLLSALAEAWPADVARDALVAHVFEVRRANETHRVRLRVEVGRLRRALAELATVTATPDGFALKAVSPVVMLLPPIDGDHAALLALLADGESWSTSALALALGASQRSVQRALVLLEEEGRARSFGRGRSQRWLGTPLIGFTTTLLLPPQPGIG
jgi:hypothetical protein